MEGKISIPKYLKFWTNGIDAEREMGSNLELRGSRHDLLQLILNPERDPKWSNKFNTWGIECDGLSKNNKISSANKEIWWWVFLIIMGEIISDCRTTRTAQPHHLLVHGRDPEVGRTLLLQLLLQASSSQVSILQEDLHLYYFHWKPHWETLHRYSILLRPPSVTSSARNAPPSFLHTGHGTVQ